MSKELPTTGETGLGKVRKGERKQSVGEVALTRAIGLKCGITMVLGKCVSQKLMKCLGEETRQKDANSVAI